MSSLDESLSSLVENVSFRDEKLSSAYLSSFTVTTATVSSSPFTSLTSTIATVLLSSAAVMDESDTSETASAIISSTIQSNLSELEEAELILGPRRDSLSTVIPMTLVYLMILLTGLIGNICTCTVIMRNKYMHTTVNYYLFSLAVSDLLLLIVGLPQELWAFWQKYPYVFGETFCILRALISEACSYASVLTITAFTIERYIAICHPLKAHTMTGLPRAIKIILIIWVVAALASVPISLQLGIIHQFSQSTKQPLPITGQCAIKHHLPYVFMISTIIFFVLPMGLILSLYFLIGIKLRQSSRSMGNSTVSTVASINSARLIKKPDLLPSPMTHSPSDSMCPSPKIVKAPHQNENSSSNYNSNSGESNSRHHLHQKGSRLVDGVNYYRAHAASRRAVVKMLVAVVVAFFICWAPFHAQRLMAIHVMGLPSPTSTEEIIFMILTHISGITYYVSATINPILYSIMSLKFRQAFKDTLGRWCGRSRRRRSPTTAFVTTTHYDERATCQLKSQV